MAKSIATLMLVLASGLSATLAHGNASFSEAYARRYGKEQLQFLQNFLASKNDLKESPAKSLVSSILGVRAGETRPPLDHVALSKDSEVSGALLLDYAEGLYAAEQYDLAAEALSLISPASRPLVAKRIEAISTKLALRGIGKLAPTSGTGGSDALHALNQALLAHYSGDVAGAISQLRKLIADQKQAPEVRHRALMWLALMFGQQGSESDVRLALDSIDGGSPLLIEALLSVLRLYGDVQPSAASAVEKKIASVAPDASARWEARDYLVRSLFSAGASSQAGEQALSAIGLIQTTIDGLNRQAEAVKKMSTAELLPLGANVSDGVKTRIDEYVQRREALRRTIDLLRAWRPYVDVYQTRLQRSPDQFGAEVRRAADVHREALYQSGQAPKSDSMSELFRLELSELFGSPPKQEVAYRLFFGFSLWQLGYEYPENWRPSVERPVEGSAVKRRRQRDPSQGNEEKNVRMLPRALGHLTKLSSEVDTQIKKQASVVYRGMADRAKDLSTRNQAQIGEIERLLPEMEEGIRSEVLNGLYARRHTAQQWMLRFAGHVTSNFSDPKGMGQQAIFDLDVALAPTRGEPITKKLQSLNSKPKTGAGRELVVNPVLGVLKTLATSGETRQIRADAFRLRAQLTLAMYEAQAIPSAKEAIDHYLTLQRDYADLIDGADTAYQLARAQDLSQRLNDSLATLAGFAKTYPDDSRTGEVLFRIAESHFSLGDYTAAQPIYGKVMQRVDTRYRDQAEYKLAWTLFKLGEFRAALPRFVAVLDRAGQGGSDGRQQERQKDAFRAVALTFAHLNGAADVERYFAENGARTYVPDIYASLTSYYLERERIKDAANAYGFLVKQAPLDARAPLLLSEVIAGARKEKLSKLVLDLQERFISTYALTGAYWLQAAEPVRAQINQRMQPYLADLGQMYHADAQQSKSAESYAKAIKYYGQYIATFPEDAKTPRFHFLMAEAQFETGDLLAARADYDLAAYHYRSHPDAVTAGYASLATSQKLAEQAKLPAEQKSRLRELVVGSGRFAEAFPSDNRVDTVLVKAAEDMLMLGEPAEAVGYAERLLARKPGDAVRRRAWLVVSHGRFESSDFAKAEVGYREALSEKGGTAEEKTALLGRLALSVYRQAEAFRTAGNSEQAINTFLRVAKSAPGTDPVPNAEIDAAALLLQTKQWARAIDVLESFQKTFPTHRLAADIPTRLAYAYENDGRFLKAADLLEALSKTEKDDPLARQMAWRAGELREKGERLDLAILTYERYLQRYPAPLERATEVRQQLANYAALNDDLVTRDRWLNEIITQARGKSDATPRVRFLAAEAAIVFGDAQAAGFEAIALKLPLDKSLAAKRTALEQSLKWYDEAGRFGVLEVTTAATYKTGELYRQLAKDVLSSERPGGLSPLEIGQYNILLEEEAFPFEEKAADIHIINHQRVRSGTFDVWVERSMSALQKLVPAKYERIEWVSNFFDYVLPLPVPKEPLPAGSGEIPGKPKTDTGSRTPGVESKPTTQGGSNVSPRP